MQRGADRIDALDGLRALAIVAVMAYHGGARWARGGFLGVDLFFVLSGYLITSVLLAEWRRTGAIALAEFWWRRARRLLPALFLLLVTVGVCVRLLGSGAGATGLRADALAALVYVANWHFIAAGRSYFTQAAGPSLLQHTWSLSIEEQFYAVWPLVMIGVLRARSTARGSVRTERRTERRPLWTLLVVTGAGAALSAMAMASLYRPAADPSRLYFGTDTHAQSILVGCCLAALLALRGPLRSRNGAQLLSLAGWLSVGGIAAAFFRTSYGATLLYRGGFLLFALVSAVVIAGLVQRRDTSLHRLLSARPVRYTGRISYGLYLWHWPLFLLVDHARTGLAGAPLLAARVAVTAAVAAASFHLVELPARRLAKPTRRRWVALPAALTAAAVVVTTTAGAAPVTFPRNIRTASATSRAPDRQPPSPPTRVLMVGDSVALTLAMGLYAAERPYGLAITSKAILGCGVVREGLVDLSGRPATSSPCLSWPRTWAQDVREVDPAVTVVLVGRWEAYDRTVLGHPTHVGDAAFDAYLTSELALAVRVLTAQGGRVVFLTAPYFSEAERPDGSLPPQDEPARVDRFNELLRQVAAGSGGQAEVLEMGSLLSPAGRYAASIGGVRVRWSDGVHITVAGGEWLAPRLLPAVAAAASGVG